jgi:hypothetical protein
VWWGIINVEFNSWNLYSSCRWHLCWNTIEKLIEIEFTGIFIMYVHVWHGYNTLEMLGLFAGSALQAISPHDQIRIDPYIQLIMAHDSHLCAWDYYIFRLVKLACLIVVGDMVQESHSFSGTRVEYMYTCNIWKWNL